MSWILLLTLSFASPEEPAGPPPAAIAHAGVGSKLDRVGVCRRAVDVALAALKRGAHPMDAAVAGVRILEDDPRLNAGTGSVVRVDGDLVQMDASVMDSTGKFGAVAVIEGVRHPIDVARAVVDTPHTVLAGEGAIQMARRMGLPDWDPSTPERKASAAALRAMLKDSDPLIPDDWARFGWPPESVVGAEDDHDTVAVVVRGHDGVFAAAASTGGTAITLQGRVGDVPILGAGLFAGPQGAVAATGKGERIMEVGLSRTVHDMLEERGLDPALAGGVEMLRGKGSVGLIAVTRDGLSGAADRTMAWAGRTLGSREWHGPSPE